MNRYIISVYNTTSFGKPNKNVVKIFITLEKLKIKFYSILFVLMYLKNCMHFL